MHGVNEIGHNRKMRQTDANHPSMDNRCRLGLTNHEDGTLWIMYPLMTVLGKMMIFSGYTIGRSGSGVAEKYGSGNFPKNVRGILFFSRFLDSSYHYPRKKKKF